MPAKKVFTDLDFSNSGRILNLPEPLVLTEPATKEYVDRIAEVNSIYNKFKYLPPEDFTDEFTYYNILLNDIGALIEVDTTLNDIEIRLPVNFPIGWWCTIVKESSNNYIRFTPSPGTSIKSKGNVLDISRSPCLLTFTDRNYWRIVGELVNI